tara:strand:- start:10370 stop:12808 length:2439 start_codon:yes stop_codon:yes gene_type:complete
METIVLLALAFLLSGGELNKEEAEYTPSNMEVVQEAYNPSATRLSDIIHTDLSVRFDWDKQHLHGTAEITAKPYFCATNKLVLDAKGFNIHGVKMGDQTLTYNYADDKLSIQLDKVYSRTESYTISIDYTAKPNELGAEGSAAITDTKGLYFINPLGEEDKPQQIWTQGETESSSCWFPTIDKPNERMTQNIAITVQEKFTTLSNGLLVKSEQNKDGTRTDYWEQSLGHTPYLAMMAVGDFNITTDKWRGIDVDYYLEDDFHKYARGIFGRTPEMMEHYSKILGVDYPWEKYAQVVVRDFVSGAMENTTAVIHGEFVQMDEREMLDRHEEDIIAHELIHHWFGDLVTCESWANLPLNEAFATYGEYIWREEGFGRMAADKHLDTDLNNYFREARSKQVDMIRFDYTDKDDMFDSHSYAKGGRILHMLRYYLGDEAFYLGLQKYLEDNAFSTVEIHQLRIAMEEVCGEDLNWFFNQWFLNSGHPILAFSYEYEDSTNTQWVYVEQLQNLETTPLYKLNMDVALYFEDSVYTYNIDVEDGAEAFAFATGSPPTNVVVDSEHVLLAEIIDEKPEEWWLDQLYAPLYMDQKFVLENLTGSALETAINHNLKHKYWGVRELAIKAIERAANPTQFETILLDVAANDNRTIVRAAAIDVLATLEGSDKYENLFEKATKEMSYAIAGAGLDALTGVNEEKALIAARMFEKESKNELEEAVMRTYAKLGDIQEFSFFEKGLQTTSNYDLYITAAYFTEYLKNQDLNTAAKGAPMIIEASKNGPSWASYYFNIMLERLLEHHLSNAENKKEAKQKFDEALN